MYAKGKLHIVISKKNKKKQKKTQQNPWRLGTHKAYFWQLPWIIFTIIAKIQ